MTHPIYLDASVLNRPFDDQSQTRIKVETEAVVAILQQIEGGRLELISSNALEFENDANPFPERRERICSYLAMATKSVAVSESRRERAQVLEALGFMGLDALHLACAEEMARTFLTVDDKLLKRASRHAESILVEVLNPLEFVQKEDLST